MAPNSGTRTGGAPFAGGRLCKLLANPICLGEITHKCARCRGEHQAIIDPSTWDAVQAKLAGNAHERRSGNGAAEPSLLAGILRDEHVNRPSPSHSVKNGARYRYHVSQAILQHRNGEAGPIVRIPAREIEELVASRIAALLEDAGQVIDGFGDSCAPREQQLPLAAARWQAERWPRMSAAEQRAFILGVVADVMLGEKEIRIVLRPNALRRAFLGGRPSVDGALQPEVSLLQTS